jgi:type I restriction enzyme R subunit
MDEFKAIAESDKFIILNRYNPIIGKDRAYQTEAELEAEFIQDLCNGNGYENINNLNSHAKMLANVRVQIESLNDIKFNDSEWQRFVNEYLDRPNDNAADKARKIHEDARYDFCFDNSPNEPRNINLVDKKNLAKNKLQVINQFEQTGTSKNRYDVTILVNGLPLVQVELKKRGVPIREAFNQIHRYTKESFNSENSLFKYLQIFVISNGTDTRYFANTTKRDKHSFDFTMNWAKADNIAIKDLKDFTATFFQKNTLLEVLFHYSVFDATNTLLIMRPYQIAATERMLWKINSSYNAKQWSKPEGGGYIWHTTGSGKTLTSFKAARLATELDFIDKVLFVVDRKDLDYQTMKEYQKFSKDSVNGSNNTAGLKDNFENNDNKIVVTTIQKLNNLIKTNDVLTVYDKQVVFIFDECHRSQFGEAQKNIKKKFKKYYQFGFTGTPIFPENAAGADTTAGVFGSQLHLYIITDAIRDEKVLKFKVDYNNIRSSRFKEIEREQDEAKLTAAENKELLLHPERIKEIAQYILNVFNEKTHRQHNPKNGFNAMFAVSSVQAAKQYYETFRDLQKDADAPIKVATIFSFAANEEQNAKGDTGDESLELSAMDNSDKEFLGLVINDYNKMFSSNFGVDSDTFQDYYRDLSKKVKAKEVDLLIVVGMFLTGFDAPQLNTLFVDKNLRYHGLIQAYSRTNRIYNAAKSFGNIVAFRDLEEATIKAIGVYGNKNNLNIILEKSYKEYMQGFKDSVTGEVKRGYWDIVTELQQRYPNPTEITLEKDKKEFVKLFGEYLRIDNTLQNYDEYTRIKDIHKLDMNDEAAVAQFKIKHHVNDNSLDGISTISIPSERNIQDYRSCYNDIREQIYRQQDAKQESNSTIDWSDITFEVELLKTQEINLDYILMVIYQQNIKFKNKQILTDIDKQELVEQMRSIIRASVGNRAKEGLINEFIMQSNLEYWRQGSAHFIEKFYEFARMEQNREMDKLIQSENLNAEAAKRYIDKALKNEYVNEYGMEINETLPKMSPLNPSYNSKKQSVLDKIRAFVEKFKQIGGN